MTAQPIPSEKVEGVQCEVHEGIAVGVVSEKTGSVRIRLRTPIACSEVLKFLCPILSFRPHLGVEDPVSDDAVPKLNLSREGGTGRLFAAGLPPSVSNRSLRSPGRVASTPGVSWSIPPGCWSKLKRSFVGFRPSRPHCAAGVRVEPPASEAVAIPAKPAASAAADPPEDPPGDRSRSQGLRVPPYISVVGVAFPPEF